MDMGSGGGGGTVGILNISLINNQLMKGNEPISLKNNLQLLHG